MFAEVKPKTNKMDKRDKQRNVFIQLVNKQLEPHGVTYNDVKDDPTWYMNYKTTRDSEREFMDWGSQLIQTELGLTQVLAEKEISWFILQWGLTSSEPYEAPTAEAVEVETTRTAKKPNRKTKR